LGGGGKAGAFMRNNLWLYFSRNKIWRYCRRVYRMCRSSAQGAFYYDIKKGNLVIRGYGAFERVWRKSWKIYRDSSTEIY
jgi:hypothetical protein